MFVPTEVKTKDGETLTRDALDVMHCISKQHYCELLFKSGEKLYFQNSIQYFDRMVAERGYIKLHEQHIVELDLIVKLYWEKAVLKNGDAVPVSRTIYHWLKNYLHQKQHPEGDFRPRPATD